MAPSDRAEVLDVLRGFALFGIFVLNLTVFSGYAFLSDIQKSSLPTAGLDAVLDGLVEFLIHDKFYSLFALLFGIGVAIQLERARLYSGYLPVFYRRLIVLLGIGLVHLLVVWYGDILTCYALVGMVLPLFLKRKNGTLLLWAAALALVPVGIAVLMSATQGDLNQSTPLEQVSLSLFNEHVRSGMIGTFRRADWLETVQANAAVATGRFATLLGEYRLPQILGMFLLGLWVGRKKLYADVAGHQIFLGRVRNGGLAFGGAAGAFLVLFPAAEVLRAFLSSIGTISLAVGYASALVLLWECPRWGHRLAVLVPAGRMALTNYLLQSFLGILLFYGIGFGFIGTVGTSVCLAAALLLFPLQVIGSRLWLSRFHFGPLEWIWRLLTYNSPQPLRKTAKPSRCATVPA